MMHPVRVLIVEDFQPFRELLSSKIKHMRGFELLAEAADGLEAVRMATELVPDLVLLDIGLPKIDGIESAKRIRKIIPSARVLFVSEHSESEIVQFACTHGEGYVLKRDVERDLLPAMNSVAYDHRAFVSRGLRKTGKPHSICRVRAISSPKLPGTGVLLVDSGLGSN
jgi:DNA-binding NarL/FixJ family response regulator